MNESDYLTRIENALMALRRNSFRHRPRFAHGLRPPEFFVLKLLGEMNDDAPPTSTELAKTMDVSVSAVTHHLNNLEKHRLIERAQSQTDRRVYNIKLSRAGKRILKSQRSTHRDQMLAFLEYLGPDDSAQLVRIIERTNEFFTKYNSGNKGK